MTALFVVVMAVVAIAFAAIWNGFVLSVLWGWFMVPTFSLPHLGVAPAIGVALVIGYLTHQRKSDKEEWGDALAYAALSPLIALGIGWIVKQWM